MALITRNDKNKIVSIHASPTRETEFVADDDPELMAFIAAVNAPPVPASVTKLQLKKALRDIDKWSDMKTALKTLSDDEQEDWDLAVEVARADPLVDQIGAALGLDSAALDAVFVAAATR